MALPTRGGAEGRRPRRSATGLRAGCALLLAGFAWTGPAFGLAPALGRAASSTLASGAPIQRPARLRQRVELRAVEALAAAGGVEATQAWGLLDTSFLASFADQGQNINGVLFQASLLPYLIFLYFLSYKGNNTPPLVQYGFGFLLLFVIATIPSGVIAKGTLGVILADSDWLHGAAESLLTCTNILLVLGFRGALQGDAEAADNASAKNVSYFWLAAVVLTIAAGVPLLGSEAHTPFLGGIGGLGADTVPAAATEPINALSLPTWLVHWSSVFEFILAMSLAWRYAQVTGNEKWKGLAWGMLPSHISSCAALTFHVFYNQIPWILTAQAFCTFLGNSTLAIAAGRIAMSNGWEVSDLNPVPAIQKAFSKEEQKEEDKPFQVAKLKPLPEGELISGPLLAVEVVLLTVVFAYGTKYGELMFASGLWTSTDSTASAVAALFCLVPPALLANTMYSNSSDLQQKLAKPST